MVRRGGRQRETDEHDRPPNAIVFASGHVAIAQMARTGLWLNLIGVVLITGAVFLLGGIITG